VREIGTYGRLLGAEGVDCGPERRVEADERHVVAMPCWECVFWVVRSEG
jgi:hypothetical protein